MKKEVKKKIILSGEEKVNVLSIDVEDYYHVAAFEKHVRFEDWDKFESRVERNTRHLLELLSQGNIKATFFFLGWVAERNKSLVREVKSQGHEIGCHSFSHKMIFTQQREEFKKDTERSKTILEDLISKEKRVCLVMEGPANNGCLPATKVVYVEPDNKDMIKVIKRIIPEHYLVFALVGSRHLNDGLIDNSLSISCPGIKSTTVFQDDFNTSLGIYELNTLKRKNYIIVGRL